MNERDEPSRSLAAGGNAEPALVQMRLARRPCRFCVGGCAECGCTGIPVDSIANADNLLLAFADDMGDVDWGPFYWHSRTRETVRRMSDHDLAWALGAGDEDWMGLVSPELKSRLSRYDAKQKATLLERASRRWREWLIANLQG